MRKVKSKKKWLIKEIQAKEFALPVTIPEMPPELAQLEEIAPPVSKLDVLHVNEPSVLKESYQPTLEDQA